VSAVQTVLDCAAAAGTLAVLIEGVRMTVRPVAFFGTGTPPATDPRTVRIFGYVFAATGLIGFGGPVTDLLEG
jgi:hypothetical protein